jgi:hypothetical protein
VTRITLFTAAIAFEQAKLMQQILTADDIQTRIINLGVKSLLGAVDRTALQVFYLCVNFCFNLRCGLKHN